MVQVRIAGERSVVGVGSIACRVAGPVYIYPVGQRGPRSSPATATGGGSGGATHGLMDWGDVGRCR